jgi:hypothetical protein
MGEYSSPLHTRKNLMATKKTSTKPRKLTETVKNGVRVRVEHSDQGSVVEADCQCFGHPLRTHSNAYCPNLATQTEAL